MADMKMITLHPERVSEALEAAFSTADAQRGAALDLLAELREARATVFKRDAERLRRVLPPDDASVLRAEARAATSGRFAAELRAEASRSRRPQPAAEEGVWIFCGHLWGADRRPIAGATIALHRRVDGREPPVEATTTAGDGYFLLRIVPDAPSDDAERLAHVVEDLRREPNREMGEELRALRSELLERGALDPAHLTGPDRASLVEGIERYARLRRIEFLPAADTSRRDAEAVTARLFLRVCNAEGRLLLAEETHTTPRRGAVTYRNVDIS